MEGYTMSGFVKIGRWEICTLEGGGLHLDGGAMFGSVPRVVWEGCIAPGDQERIPLPTRVWLLKDSESDRIAVIDAGVGDKEDPSFRDRFAIWLPEGHSEPPLWSAIRSAGVDPDTVTDLVITHLHFDHVGGATQRNDAGESVPVLPNAKHWVQQRNWDTALSPNPREKSSYLRENVEPLEDTLLERIDGPGEIFPGVSVEEVHGHTLGMQTVRIEGGGKVVRYLADLAPTLHHLRAAWTMGYDIHALKVVEEKQALLKSASQEEALLVLEHDPVNSWAKVVHQNGRFKAEPVQPEYDSSSSAQSPSLEEPL